MAQRDNASYFPLRAEAKIKWAEGGDQRWGGGMDEERTANRHKSRAPASTVLQQSSVGAGGTTECIFEISRITVFEASMGSIARSCL